MTASCHAHHGDRGVGSSSSARIRVELVDQGEADNPVSVVTSAVPIAAPGPARCTRLQRTELAYAGGDAGVPVTAPARDLRIVTKLVITAPRFATSRATNRVIPED